jgi:hypothetical protein
MPLTLFVGRETELAETERALIAQRLVTTTSPGGIGKTRLRSAVRRPSTTASATVYGSPT